MPYWHTCIALLNRHYFAITPAATAGNFVMSEIIHQTSHGNTISIEFEYPEDNPQNYAEDITTALNYAGVFQGISRKDANLQ